MGERALRLERYIKALAALNERVEKINLNEIQWKRLADICKILEPFRLAQQMLEGEKYPTSSLVPQVIHFLRIKLRNVLQQQDNNSEYINKYVIILYNSFVEEWGNEDRFGNHLQEGLIQTYY